MTWVIARNLGWFSVLGSGFWILGFGFRVAGFVLMLGLASYLEEPRLSELLRSLEVEGYRGLEFRVGMFPLILTVLNRDYSTPYCDPS